MDLEALCAAKGEKSPDADIYDTIAERLSEQIRRTHTDINSLPMSVKMFLRNGKTNRHILPGLPQMIECSKILKCSMDYLTGMDNDTDLWKTVPDFPSYEMSFGGCLRNRSTRTHLKLGSGRNGFGWQVRSDNSDKLSYINRKKTWQLLFGHKIPQQTRKISDLSIPERHMIRYLEESQQFPRRWIEQAFHIRAETIKNVLRNGDGDEK